MTTLSALIARLEAAKEGSRELDADIAEFIGLDGRRDVSNDSMRRLGMSAHDVIAKHYTTSLDAALTLVPEGYAFSIHAGKRGALAMVCRDWDDDYSPIYRSYEFDRTKGRHKTFERHEDKAGNYRTPALALCIATLKAREARR